jgi:pimeloyl-ACP methyl ester carboxylesterase
MRRAWMSMAVAVLAGAGLFVAGCGGSPPPSAGSLVKARLLSVSDLPAGWSSIALKAASAQPTVSCLAGMPATMTGLTSATAAFVQGSGVPSFGEVLATGPQAAARWARLDQAMAACHSTTLAISGVTTPVTIKPFAFPQVGRASSAYLWAFTASGIAFSTVLVSFSAGDYQGYIEYSAVGAPVTSTVDAFAAAAAAKAVSGTTAAVPDSVSVTSEPVQVTSTSMGNVGYREIGDGPPLVLIMGFGGTMSTWDPAFVDALAQRYRVVIFDNAGIGQTAGFPGTLSIDDMANQTSALITALGLGRPYVLGWSMGTMIAQALAVLHPAQVRALVLSASYPGNGATIRPPQSAINALSSPDTQTVLGALFPADQVAAGVSYLTATSSYPPGDAAPAAVITGQRHAIDAWWAGTDPAGQHLSAITVPTLIADGAEDRLDPSANDRADAGVIQGARLMFFPDAGHAFLFQDEASYVPAIESFLAGVPS